MNKHVTKENQQQSEKHNVNGSITPYSAQRSDSLRWRAEKEDTSRFSCTMHRANRKREENRFAQPGSGEQEVARAVAIRRGWEWRTWRLERNRNTGPRTASLTQGTERFWFCCRHTRSRIWICFYSIACRIRVGAGKATSIAPPGPESAEGWFSHSVSWKYEKIKHQHNFMR